MTENFCEDEKHLHIHLLLSSLITFFNNNKGLRDSVMTVMIVDQIIAPKDFTHIYNAHIYVFPYM